MTSNTLSWNHFSVSEAEFIYDTKRVSMWLSEYDTSSSIKKRSCFKKHELQSLYEFKSYVIYTSLYLDYIMIRILFVSCLRSSTTKIQLPWFLPEYLPSLNP